MSDFTWIPSKGVRNNPQVITTETQFGDGYKQVSPNAIDNIRDVWSVPFNDREASEIKAITDFIRTRKGSVPFTWTPPAPYNTEITVICKKFPLQMDRKDENSIMLEFEEFKALT